MARSLKFYENDDRDLLMQATEDGAVLTITSATIKIMDSHNQAIVAEGTAVDSIDGNNIMHYKVTDVSEGDYTAYFTALIDGEEITGVLRYNVLTKNGKG